VLTGLNRDTWHVRFSQVSSVAKGYFDWFAYRGGVAAGKSPVQVPGLGTISRSCHSPKFTHYLE
jgi:hypothetical protein